MTNLLNKKTKKKGFTLIELIIVLAVMAIIAAIAIPSFSAVRNNSKVKADKQSEETIKRSVLALVADETIKQGTDNKTVTFTDGTQELANMTFSANWTDEEKNKFKEAVAEVKVPQESGKTKYTITITTGGNVSVVTAS